MTINKHLQHRLLYNGLLSLFWFIAPLFVSFIMLFIAIVKKTININLVFILFALSFALVNYTKTPQSDLLEYYDSFQLLIDTPISDFFDFVHIDFVFYFVSMLIGTIFNDVHIILLFWTFMAYYLYFKSLELINNRFYNKDTKLLLILILFSVTLGLLFNQSSHLVRQFVAASFLIYSLAITDAGEKRKGFIYYFIGLNIHFSLILFLPVYIMNSQKKKIYSIWIVAFLLFALVLGSDNILIYLSSLFYEVNNPTLGQIVLRMTDYVDKNNGDIQLGQFIKLSGFFVISFIMMMKSDRFFYITFALVYLILILVLLRNTDLILIRYFIYSQFFYGVILLIIMKNINNKLLNMIFLFYCFYGIGLFISGIYTSSWKYISNDLSLFYTNIFSFLSYWS